MVVYPPERRGVSGCGYLANTRFMVSQPKNHREAPGTTFICRLQKLLPAWTFNQGRLFFKNNGYFVWSGLHFVYSLINHDETAYVKNMMSFLFWR